MVPHNPQPNNDINALIDASDDIADCGAVGTSAIARIQQRLQNGDALRPDVVFGHSDATRPAAEEVYKGMVLAAQSEHEEKKLRFMGNLITNLAFHSEIDRRYANYLVRVSESLSYFQLCLLDVFARHDKSALWQEGYHESGHLSPAMTHLLHECAELEKRGLIHFGSVAFGLTDLNPSQTCLQGAGALIFTLMELHTLPASDVAEVAALLK